MGASLSQIDILAIDYFYYFDADSYGNTRNHLMYLSDNALLGIVDDFGQNDM